MMSFEAQNYKEFCLLFLVVFVLSLLGLYWTTNISTAKLQHVNSQKTCEQKI